MTDVRKTTNFRDSLDMIRYEYTLSQEELLQQKQKLKMVNGVNER